MTSFLRLLLVAIALSTSGALQVAAALGEDPCCAETTEQGDEDASCPDCPPGLACACCPTRGALQASAVELAPSATTPGVAIAVVAAEPSLGASVTDIFHPPRA